MPFLGELVGICQNTGIICKFGFIEIPKIKLEDKYHIPIIIPYSEVFCSFLDLSREIFRDEIIESRDPLKVLFEKALTSSCLGKPVQFFKDAKFEGLDLLSEINRAIELRAYRNFLINLDYYPSPINMVLLRAFIGAGVYKEGLEAVELRKQILDLKEKLA
jgi:hypothetical protein